jgi:hypothetical protein
MEKAYKNITVFFIAIALVLIWGFYRTYLVYFPGFTGFTYVQHVHGFLMFTWLCFIIAQPLLIRAKNYKAHRIIGKVSYFIVPLLLFSIFLVTKMVYYRTLKADSLREAIASITVSIPDLLSFAIFYYLAIKNKKNIPKHMRYMIGTSLLLISPGLGRAFAIYFNWPITYALAIPDYIAMGIVIFLIGYDYRNKKNYYPYLIILAVLVVRHSIWLLRYTDIWQIPGGQFAKFLF